MVSTKPQKQLRMEDRAHIAGGGTFLSACLGMPINPDGDVTMVHDTTLLDDAASRPILASRPKSNSNPTVARQQSSLSGMALSLAKLDADSHAVRLKQAEIEQKDKQTARTYQLAVESYEKWWGSYQASLSANDASYTPIPAFPVTAAKVVMFLDYETMRPKVNVLFHVLFHPC
jgi:hypothetical protein